MMRLCSFDKLKDLSDLFRAVIGGEPESLEEIDAFLQQNSLKELLSKHDIEKVLKYGGYFAEEHIDAIYALLPVEVTLQSDKKIILYPKALRQLNLVTSQQAGSRVINIGFDKIFSIHIKYFRAKIQNVLKRRAEIQNEKELKEQQIPHLLNSSKVQEKKLFHEVPKANRTKTNLSNLEQTQNSSQSKKKKKKVSSLDCAQAYQRNRQIQKQKKFQQKIEINEKQIQKIQSQPEEESSKRGLTDNITPIQTARKNGQPQRNDISKVPQINKSDNLSSKKVSSYNKEAYERKRATMSEEEKEKKRAQNRKINAKYRAKNKLRLNLEAKERRAKLKAEDPEKLKELNRINNSKANRKKICSDYYQRHKAEISMKAQDNPRTNIYKKRYKVKQRFKEKTGPILLSLLQGIIAHKNSR